MDEKYIDNNSGSNLKSGVPGSTGVSNGAGATRGIAVPRWKRTAILMAGFGFGGLLWGFEAYRGTVGTDDAFVSPFSFILGAVAMGFFGGLAVAIVKKMDNLNSSKSLGHLFFDKETAKIVGVSTVAWVGAFGVVSMLDYHLWLYGSILGIIPEIFLDGEIIEQFISLDSSMDIGYLWIGFLLVGLIAGVIYLLVTRLNILSSAGYSALGFGISSLFSPIIGNVFGNLLNILVMNYLATFLLLGVLFGLILGLISKKESKGFSKTSP